MTLAMLSVSDQLMIYEEIHALSGQMVTAAQANDWDSLIALESCVATLRDRLMSGEGADSLVLSAAESAQKSAMIRKILENDAEIRRHVEPWMDNVRQFLGSQSQRRKMQHAYAATDIPSESGAAAGASFG
jgi:flagellar protein FliT